MTTTKREFKELASINEVLEMACYRANKTLFIKYGFEIENFKDDVDHYANGVYVALYDLCGAFEPYAVVQCFNSCGAFRLLLVRLAIKVILTERKDETNRARTRKINPSIVKGRNNPNLAFWTAFEGLPLEYQQAIKLKAQGLTFVEVSEQLGVATITVKRWFKSIREELSNFER